MNELVSAALRIIAGIGSDGDASDLMNDRVDNACWHPNWRNNTSDRGQVIHAAIGYLEERIGK